MRLGMRSLPSVFISTTTRVSHTAGDASLPWPEREKGSKVMAWKLPSEMPWALFCLYVMRVRHSVWVWSAVSGKRGNLRAANIPRVTVIQSEHALASLSNRAKLCLGMLQMSVISCISISIGSSVAFRCGVAPCCCPSLRSLTHVSLRKRLKSASNK